MTYDFQSINCYTENVCGDSFLCERNGNDILFVHSDGMGHGSKANVLSELTCEIVMSEWRGVHSLQAIVEMLSYRLPICATQGFGYSTFTLIDYNERSGEVTIVQYESPTVLLLRNGSVTELPPERYSVSWRTDRREVKVIHFCAQTGDRLIVVSDGVTQSGVGGESMSFGWGTRAFGEFVSGIVVSRSDISCSELCDRVLNQALSNEAYYSHDDMSMLAITF